MPRRPQPVSQCPSGKDCACAVFLMPSLAGKPNTSSQVRGLWNKAPTYPGPCARRPSPPVKSGLTTRGGRSLKQAGPLPSEHDKHLQARLGGMPPVPPGTSSLATHRQSASHGQVHRGFCCGVLGRLDRPGIRMGGGNGTGGKIEKEEEKKEES